MKIIHEFSFLNWDAAPVEDQKPVVSRVYTEGGSADGEQSDMFPELQDESAPARVNQRLPFEEPDMFGG